MPVFVEQSSADRDSRVNPAQLSPLPRVSPAPPPLDEKDEKYEVVVVGSGPAGIMTSVLLARYGITSVLTVDSKPAALHSGQADGLQPRTLEVLQSLDLAHEVLTQGCQMHEVGFWNPADDGNGIVRTAFVPDVAVPARFPHEVTIHQGRIERILNQDLAKSGNAVQRGWTVEGYEEEELGAWPIIVRMKQTEGEGTRVVRCKYLVGCDGAHSTIRKGMGLDLVGDHTDHVWGVMDSVVNTTFPDIRKRCAIHSPAGSIMIIPRERINNKQVLTRIYCQMEDDVETDPTIIDHKSKSKARRSKVTLERITSQTQKVLAPYTISFGAVDWWAAYQIGQRVAPSFSSPSLRVHIAGDACHTHSPKAGQGMNVSMMDAYNLSWKLAHVLLGLSSPSLLSTYNDERLSIARQLIEFDGKFSRMFSGQIDSASGLTHEQFVEVFRTGGGFTSGCGIEYDPGLLVDPDTNSVLARMTEPELGLLYPGRRLFNTTVRRFCDANPRQLQDEFPSTGVYRILVLLPKEFKSQWSLIEECVTTIPGRFPEDVVETVVLFHGKRETLEWTDFPDSVRVKAEWKLLGEDGNGGYETFGVKVEEGAVAVVRPDGVVGMVTGLQGAGERVGNWLKKILL